MPKFIVEGQFEDGTHQPDGEGTPFLLFSPTMQDWLPTPYNTREAAEAARAKLESLTHYAVNEFGHVKLYRLDEDATKSFPPVATFTSRAEFERFVGKSMDAFNGVAL